MAANKHIPEFDPNYQAKQSRLYKREDVIYNVTEDILCLLEDLGLTKNDLAKKMGSKSRSFISQILSGSRNMTLGTLSDICHALEADLKISIQRTNQNQLWKEESDTVNLSTISISPDKKPFKKVTSINKGKYNWTAEKAA